MLGGEDSAAVVWDRNERRTIRFLQTALTRQKLYSSAAQTERSSFRTLRATELLLLQGCLRIAPTVNRNTWSLLDRCTRVRHTPIGMAGGLSSRELIGNPKWIHLHMGRTAQTHFRTGPRTIEFSGHYAIALNFIRTSPRRALAH